MNESHFVPTTDVEISLATAMTDRDALIPFMNRFLAEKVFILLSAHPSTVPGGLPDPLAILSHGGFHAICLFTTQERATPMAERFEEFRHGLLVDCRWLLARINPSCGIVVNPGWAVGLEIPPEGFARLKRDFGLVPAAA